MAKQSLRFRVFLRDGFCCCYCGQQFPFEELTTDHIKPKIRGGKTNLRNLATACRPCNIAKSGKYKPEHKVLRVLILWRTLKCGL